MADCVVLVVSSALLTASGEPLGFLLIYVLMVFSCGAVGSTALRLFKVCWNQRAVMYARAINICFDVWLAAWERVKSPG